MNGLAQDGPLRIDMSKHEQRGVHPSSASLREPQGERATVWMQRVAVKSKGERLGSSLAGRARFALTCVAAMTSAALQCAATVANAQTYPNRPIRMIVSGVGGSSNFAARLIGPALSEKLGQQVVIDNRGTGIVAIEIAAKSAPDGYTFILNGSLLWLMPFMREGLSYEPLRDFTPVVLVIRAPNVLTVHPNVAARSVQELIALAREKPGALNYGSSGIGGFGHISGELFCQLANVKMTHIPYKSSAPSLTDLISGQIQVLFNNMISTVPHVKANRVRALATTGAKRSPAPPDSATVGSSGNAGERLAPVVASARTRFAFTCGTVEIMLLKRTWI